MKVLISLFTNVPALNPPNNELKKLARRFPKVRFTTSPADIEQADVIFGWAISERAVKGLKNLKWFHTAGVQYENILPKQLFKKAVVTNSRGVWADYLAKALFTRLLKLIPAKKARGKTAGIIGLGGNGTAVAKLARKYGMKVVATSKDITHGQKGLNDIVKTSDLIFVSVPLTKKTFGLLGKKEFKMMKKGAVILSSSRPQVIDAKDLKASLAAKRITGAVLDETWPDDIKKLRGVTVFPHASPLHYNVWPKMFDIFAKELERFIKKEPLLNRIRP